MSQDINQLLENLMAERHAWEALLNQVEAERFTLPGVSGDWSLKDVIAHIMSYEEYLFDRLLEIVSNKPYMPSENTEALADFLDQFGYPDFGSPLLDDDEPNAWVVERYQGESLQTVMDKEAQVFAQLVEVIEGLPEKVWKDAEIVETIENNTTIHFQHHIRDLQDWLQARHHG